MHSSISTLDPETAAKSRQVLTDAIKAWAKQLAAQRQACAPAANALAFALDFGYCSGAIGWHTITESLLACGDEVIDENDRDLLLLFTTAVVAHWLAQHGEPTADALVIRTLEQGAAHLPKSRELNHKLRFSTEGSLDARLTQLISDLSQRSEASTIPTNPKRLGLSYLTERVRSLIAAIGLADAKEVNLLQDMARDTYELRLPTSVQQQWEEVDRDFLREVEDALIEARAALLQWLKEYGVHLEIPSIGEPFDPVRAESADEAPSDRCRVSAVVLPGVSVQGQLKARAIVRLSNASKETVGNAR